MNDQLLPQYRHPYWVDEDKSPLPMLFDADGFPVIQFEPVPQLRRRRHGWDAERQRAFVAMLCRVPSVGHAARAVGMSARSAYKLLDKPGAEQFGKAWDMALEEGMARLRGQSLSRSLEGGDYVPLFRKGKLVRVEYRRNDRLGIALLSGQQRDVDGYRRGAQTRWRQRREWDLADAARAEEEAKREQARRDYLREMEEFVARDTPPRHGPRIRIL